MIKRRIHRRVFELNEMMSQTRNFLVLCPFINAESNYRRNPVFVSFKVEYFCSSSRSKYPKVSNFVSNQSHNSIFPARMSRITRVEAQYVLFDYLHSTRGLSFTDAEHISKNSPQFLQSLLANVDGDKDVSRSLAKFLRYNPINEFEPFFESLGLSPSDISSLLPKQHIYLDDDDVLLENFHVLCNYGVPCEKIGKIFKQAREVFWSDYGVVSHKLQVYENLGLKRATVVKLVSSCPHLLVGGVDSDFVKVLEKLNRAGVKNGLIGTYVSVDHSCNWKRILDMLEFLDKVGYTDVQLQSLLKTNPGLVFETSGKKVYVLFGRLLKLGLSMDEVYLLFIQCPGIVAAKPLKNLSRMLDCFIEINLPGKDIAKFLGMHVEVICSCSLKGPKTLFRESKLTKDSLFQMITEDPAQFISLASKSEKKSRKQRNARDPSYRMEKTAFLLRLGYAENSDEMMKALKKFRGRGDQLQERFDCLVQAGLDSNVVTGLIRQAPMVLNLSKDVIEKKIDCLTKHLGYSIDSLVAFPAYLCYDMERINQRFEMYVWLRERSVAKPALSLSTILAASDSRFKKYFVHIHPEGQAKWESLKNGQASS